MTKGTKWLLLILIVLAVLYELVININKIQRKNTNNKVNISNIISTSTQIAINYSNISYDFYKKDGNWRIKDTKKGLDDAVDTARTNILFSSLKKIELIGLITSNPKDYNEFGINDTASLKITFDYRKTKKKVLYIGNNGPNYNSVYIRFSTGKNVYLVRNIKSYTIKRHANYWRNREILNVTKNTFRGLNFVKKNKVVSVYQKNDGNWYKKVGKRETILDTSTINRLIASINQIEIDNFAPTNDTKFYNLDKSKNSMTIKYKNTGITFRFGKITNSEYSVRISGRSEIYLINAYRIDNITKFLLPKAAVNAKPPHKRRVRYRRRRIRVPHQPRNP